jgi:hypothetical protein
MRVSDLAFGERSASAAGRGAHHELRLEHDLLVVMIGVGGLVQDQLGGPGAQLLAWRAPDLALDWVAAERRLPNRTA